MTMTNFYELIAMDMMPLPMVSATMDGCMEKGADVVWGGAKYNSTGCSGVGCANVADGLAAIKYLVFDTKKYTAREFYDALMANWEGYEAMRQEVLNSVPRLRQRRPVCRWAGEMGHAGVYRPCQPGYGSERHVQAGAVPCFRTYHDGDPDGGFAGRQKSGRASGRRAYRRSRAWTKTARRRS